MIEIILMEIIKNNNNKTHDNKHNDKTKNSSFFFHITDVTISRMIKLMYLKWI